MNYFREEGGVEFVGMRWVREGWGWKRSILRRMRRTGRMQWSQVVKVLADREFCMRCLGQPVQVVRREHKRLTFHCSTCGQTYDIMEES